MIEVIFNEDEHKYYLDNKQYPSVTQIIDHFGLAGYIPDNDVTRRAMDFGTAVHKTIELFEKGDLDEWDLDENLIPYLNAYKKFKESNPNLDKIVIDYKSGAAYKWHGIQTAGYKILCENKSNEFLYQEKPLVSKTWGFAGTPDYAKSTTGKIIHRWTVYLKPDEFKITKHKDEKDSAIFKSLMLIYNWKKERNLL